MYPFPSLFLRFQAKYPVTRQQVQDEKYDEAYPEFEFFPGGMKPFFMRSPAVCGRGISMSATSSKVLQAKIACRNSSTLSQHSSLNHRVLGYRSVISSCSFCSGNGSGLSLYSYSMEITRPCIPVKYPNIPCHFTLCAPVSTYFVPVASTTI